MSREQNLKRRLHAFVSGRVQGVGFRHYVMTEVAGTCPEVVGKLRNTYDGKVEVIAEGTEYELKTMCAILQQGPRWSVVEDVTQMWGPAHSDLGSTFTVSFSNEEWSV
jgi:acylphosphatase